MKTVHYIGKYITAQEWGTYVANVPGMMKMRYVADKILESGCILNIVSLADKNVKGFYCSKIFEHGGKTILYTGGIGAKSGVKSYFRTLYKQFALLKYILCKTKKDDLIVLYHSVPFTSVVSRLVGRLNRKFVLEVEEIYGYNAVEDKPWVDDEIKKIKKFKKFTCVNDGIPRVLGLDPNDYVVIYGAGIFPPRTAERFDDGKIHVVYSGTIEGKKMGAMTAVESAKYLTPNYKLHISGFGNNNSVTLLQKRISEINEELGEERIKYEGFLSEEDMHKLMFSCHIGLSPNVLRANFANSTFPSKVVTYMCHDLAVVISYATAYDFPISNGWVFYREQKPEVIAKAVMEAKVLPIGFYRPAIKEMNNNVVSFFSNLLK